MNVALIYKSGNNNYTLNVKTKPSLWTMLNSFIWTILTWNNSFNNSGIVALYVCAKWQSHTFVGMTIKLDLRL